MTESRGERERLVLVHGATSGPWVFDGWPGAFPGYDVRVPDLQEGLDVAQARMSDYVDRVLGEVADRPSVVCGWSMGGLVALMAAQRSTMVAALVVIEPSLPVELTGGDPRRALRSGTYDAESAYGPVAPGTRHRPESLLAFDERKRGISVPSVTCPLLVVAGRSGPPRGRQVAQHYGADLVEFPDLGHSDLVADPGVMAGIASWLAGVERRR
ncbi:alpha/beta fold hydrolase [Actinotalea sp. Marseille-Q4924]|uniref:alpha/beta fold hydrolase n=1 Tax=Actinotalea sp. Marseille-Q4924 TaxID=2866571 RepID=UPI001CE4286E|nr:alpha/beta hydrolase [Actinotalea sp. Marseille-Q4924]